jgi:hypothetical protein
MSMGNSPADRAIGKQHSERLMAKADAECQWPSYGGSGSIVVTWVAGVAHSVRIAAFVIMAGVRS